MPDPISLKALQELCQISNQHSRRQAHAALPQLLEAMGIAMRALNWYSVPGSGWLIEADIRSGKFGATAREALARINERVVE